MKTRILSILKSQEDYMSGQKLCGLLGVSRTAVWKVINQLREEGYVIESISNKGYKIIETPDIILKNELESRIKTKWAGKQVVYYDTVDSTNTAAKKLAEEKFPHGTLAVAEAQSSGKARRGRSWESPVGAAIYMSILLRPDINPDHASMLTLVMAMSVTKACEELCQAECGIKWPNDVVINKKKICGILTEMSTEIDYINHVVIGVGINVNNQSMPETIRDYATSLRIEAGNSYLRAELIEKVMNFFERYYEAFLKSKDLSFMLEEYNKKLLNSNNEVIVLNPKNEYTGISKGINALGELLVEREDGYVEHVYAGEVSVRGVYGYV